MKDRLKDTFSLIDYIDRSKRYTYDNGEITWLRKKDDAFVLKDDSFTSREFYKNILIKNKKSQLIIPYFLDCSTHTNVSDTVTRSNLYKVDSFKSHEFDIGIESFYRLIIPIHKKLDFFTTIEHDSISHCSFALFQKQFDFYEISEKKQKYLVIDSPNSISFDLFSAYCFSILVSYGFLTGDFFQGKKYYFRYNNQKLDSPVGYAFDAFRETITSILRPICTNPHAYSIKNVEMSELEKISKQQFALLCEKSISNTDFRMLLLQIIEASKATLLTSTFMLAVCLEELVEIFLTAEDKQKALNSQEKKVYNEVIKSLNQIMCDSDKEKDFLNTFLSSAHNIGKNASNMQKIYKLFDKIDLTNREKEALQNRNKLLHGTLPEIQGINLDSEMKIDKAYWYLQLRLYTLVSMAVLKNIGFQNKVLNQYSLNENGIGFFKLNERKYRDLK